MRFQTDFSQKLKNFDGQPLRSGVDAAVVQAVLAVTADFDEPRLEKLNAELDRVWRKELTLATVCVDALLAHHEEEKKLGGSDQLHRHRLAQRLHKGGLQEFNTEERDLLKNVVRMGYKGNVVFPLVHELLEGAERVAELAAVKA